MMPPNSKRNSLESDEDALDDIGGEPLDGSGFEQEKPEPDFTDVDSPA